MRGRVRRLAISIFVLQLAYVLVATPARATTYTITVLNDNFAAASTAEWEMCDPATDTPETTVPPTGTCDATSSVGSWNSSLGKCDVTPVPADDYSALLQPADSSHNVAIRQRLVAGDIVGRTLSISFCWKRFFAGNRRAKVTVAWKKQRGTAASGVYDRTCTQTYANADTNWHRPTALSCTIPGIGGTKVLSDVYLQIESANPASGTPSGDIRVDDISITSQDAAATWNATWGTCTNCRTETLPTISASNEIVAVSRSDQVVYDNGVQGPINIREVYVTGATGGSRTRITNQSGQPGGARYDQMHPSVSPDRQYISVVRFIEDWNNDGKFTTVVDPQAVWILDTVNDRAVQLSPYWQDAALAGAPWLDNSFVLYSVDIGRYTSIYKVKFDGSVAAVKISDSAQNDWESDVGISPDGSHIVFHVEERNSNGTYQDLGKIYKMQISDAPCSNCPSRVQVTAGGTLIAREAPDNSGLPVGDYDPEFNQDETKIILWRNTCIDNGTPGTTCDSSTSTGWSVVKCTNLSNCASNSSTLVDGGNSPVGTNTQIYLIVDWGPAASNPIIMGLKDTNAGPPDARYNGIFAMNESETESQGDKIEQGQGYTGNCLGDTIANECESWPRWIDRL